MASESCSSNERFAYPFELNGIPTLAATLQDSPSPSLYSPLLISSLVPSELSSRTKFKIPAIASDPYCAAAPSLKTSTCFRAIEGIAEISGPCAPSEIPLPKKDITAPLCLLLPFTSTSILSGGRPLKFAGLIRVAASLIGCVLTLKEGTRVRIISGTSIAP